MKTEQEIKALLKKLTPEQRGIAQTITGLQIENRQLQNDLAQLKGAYDPLYKVMLAICHAMPKKEYRVHKSQFLRFRHEYRIDSFFDEKTQEMVFRLLTISDELGEGDASS